MPSLPYVAFVSVSLLVAVAPARADLALDPLFRDRAVLQRQRPVPVTGRAKPGETVAVRLGDGVPVSAVAGPDGRFRAELPPLEASLEGRTLRAEAPSGFVEVADVVVGEVWFCSGQSNMEWPVDASNDADRARSIAAKVPVRSFKAPQLTANRPAADVPGEWTIAAPESVGSFTAVGFWFGVDLARSFGLDVPIGLVDLSWGGTRIEPWIPLDEMAASEEFGDLARGLASRIAAFEAEPPDARARAIAAERAGFEEAKAAYWSAVLSVEPGAQAGWSSPAEMPDFPDQWRVARLPGFFPSIDESLRGFDGTVWFTREFEVPAAAAGRPATIAFGPIDDSDVVWIDGHEAGSTVGEWSSPRRYRIGAGLSAGVHRIAVCVLDVAGEGGFGGDRGSMHVSFDGLADRVPLDGGWMWRRGAEAPRVPVPVMRDLAKAPGTEPHEPAAIYNAMIAPCIGYPARGVLWYQGESNAGEPDRYRGLLPLLMDSWRRKSSNPSLAWGIVQLAAFMQPADAEPAQGGWALLREAQYRGAASGGGGMVSAIDLGDADDIHPRRKREIGERLAAWARSTVYGEGAAAWQGPALESATRENGSLVRLRFTHAEGLRATGGAPGGFALAGADGRFVWATATIMDGGRDGIIVTAQGIDDPVEVAYAWQDNPVRANVVNGAGLPMIPFRERIGR